jgi:hypothetical protein
MKFMMIQDIRQISGDSAGVEVLEKMAVATALLLSG